MTPAEFGAWVKAAAKLREAESRERWEQARLIAAVSVSPHLRKGASRNPKKIIPLAWDSKGEAKEKAPGREITREEAGAQFEMLMKSRKSTT